MTTPTRPGKSVPALPFMISSAVSSSYSSSTGPKSGVGARAADPLAAADAGDEDDVVGEDGTDEREDAADACRKTDLRKKNFCSSTASRF